MKGTLKGHAVLLAANIIWGLNAPITKSVLQTAEHPDGIDPFALSAWRMVGAGLLLWLVSLFMPRERVPLRDLGALLVASLFGIQLNQMLFLWGLSLSSPINASIIATVVPILTMVFAMFFLREPITWKKAAGVALGAGGAVMLVLLSTRGFGQTASLKGDLINLGAAVSYAVYLTACRNSIVKYSPVTTMKWMFLFAAAVAFVLYHGQVAHVDYGALTPRVWGGILYVICLSTFLAYLLVPIAQRYLRPTVVSIYAYVQPVVSVLFSVAIGLDAFGYTKAAAALCIFAGVWLVTRSKSRAQLEMERSSKLSRPAANPPMRSKE